MFKFVSTKNNTELFHRAILSDDLPRTKLILEEAMKDPRFDIDEINEEGLTALQFSCFAGYIDTVKVLVSFKADTKKRDRDGNTLLHAAALAGKSEVVKFLLRSGSLKPVVRNDEQEMPIDMTEEISTVVVLLRAMLDQGYLEEMQEYMLEHPKLERDISEELKRVKCRENERTAILKELPYTSHTSPRRQKLAENQRRSSQEMLGRSISTFSKLSGSMQFLDRAIQPQSNEDKNNNYNQNYHRNDQHSHHHHHQQQHYDSAPSLKRQNSTGSTSSHGSRSSRSSKGSSVVRGEASAIRGNESGRSDFNNKHQQTQKYLENRFPSQNQRPYEQNNRNYSDGYISDSYEHPKGGGRLSRSSSISSHSSNHTGVFSDTCSNFDFPPQDHGTGTARADPSQPPTQNHQHPYRQQEEENFYQNIAPQPPHRANSLPTINEGENIYENLPLRIKSTSQLMNPINAPKYIPPPLPPRQPTNNAHRQPTSTNNIRTTSYANEYDSIDTSIASSSSFQTYNNSSAANGSETDSGIDINETTAGRVFALSLDEQQHQQQQQRNDITPEASVTSYSKPIGIYYSEHMNQTTVRRDGEITNNDRMLNNNPKQQPQHNNIQQNMMMSANPKYRSWNGRTLLESQQQHQQFDQESPIPYSTHSRRQRSASRDDYDVHRGQQQQHYTHAQNGYQDHGVRRHTASVVELRQFNFDHQPEIML